MKKLIVSISLIVLCGVSAINAFDYTLQSVDTFTDYLTPGGVSTYFLPDTMGLVQKIEAMPLQEQKELLMNPDMTINTALLDRFIELTKKMLDSSRSSTRLTDKANAMKNQIVKSVFRLLVGCGFITDDETKKVLLKQIDSYCENKMIEYIAQKYPEANVIIDRAYMGG